LSGEGGGGAFLSGWCQVFSYFDRYFIEAQFPLTDHATFPELLSFAKACAPKNVITVHGKAATLAAEVERRLGIPARPLLDRERSPAEALVASPP
jgi:Cft2 family RNA processing exonuclease